MLFIETVIFDIMMALVNCVNALLDLIENKSEYPPHHIRLEDIKEFSGRLRNRASSINWSQIKLLLLCFFFPPLAVFFKKGGLFNFPFLFSIVTLFTGIWPLTVLHALYIVNHDVIFEEL